MMMGIKRMIYITAFAVIGLVVGYMFFGKYAGEYISLKTLFSFGGNRVQNAFRAIAGIDEMRSRVLLCGAIGAMVGLLFPIKTKK
jgi:hypothetical protein